MQYITTKTLFRLRVLLLSGTIAILAIVFIDIYTNNSKPGGGLGRRGAKSLENQQEQLKNADEMLHARLWQLQDLDQQFAAQLSNQFDLAGLERTNSAIQLSEEGFRKSIDSVARVGSSYDDQSGTNEFQNMTTFFKKILENRRFIAFTRMGMLAGGAGAGNEKQTILRLQNQLYEKDKQIASSANNKTVISLQEQLSEKDKQIAALETEKQTFVQSNQKLQSEVSEKDKIIASMGNKNPGSDDKLLAKLQTEANTKNTQITTLQAQLQADKQSYTQTIQKLQNDLKEKDKQIASFANRTGSEDKRALASLQNELTSKNRQITDLQAQVQKEQADKKAYVQSASKYQADIAQKNKMIDALSNIKIPTDDKAIASLQKEISAKNRQISDLENQLTQKDAASSTNKSSNDRGLAALQNEVNTKNKQISTLQAEVKKESDQKLYFKETMQALQAELIEKNKIIASAGNRKLPSDQKALVTLQNEIAEKDRRIRRLEDQLQNSGGNRAIQTSNVSTQESNNLRLAYNTTMTQLGVLQKKYNLLKAEMDQLKGQR